MTGQVIVTTSKCHTHEAIQEMGKQQVVLITGTVYPRMAKIGYALKSLGWEVVLLHCNDFFVQDQQQCFNQVYRYGSGEEALDLARRFRPLVYHVFCVWDYNVALALLSSGVGPVVLDNYDSLGGMVKPEFVSSRYPQIFEKERLCIEYAAGHCCRNVALNYQRRVLGYAPRGKTLFFPDYCWSDRRPQAESSCQKQDGIHVVYAGNLNVEKQCRHDPYRMKFKSDFYLEFGRDLATSGIHFHLYPAQHVCHPEQFEDVFSEYFEAAEQNPFFHIHRPVPVETLIGEMRQYSVGIEAAWREFNTVGTDSGLPIRCQYNMSNKLFDYIDSGLGLLISDNFDMRRWYFGRKRIVITSYLDDARQVLVSKDTDYWRDIKVRVDEVARQFAVSRHAPRLAEFYFSVSNSNRGNKLMMQYPLSKTNSLANEDTNASVEIQKTADEIAHPDEMTPKIFAVETSLVCDLKCPECATGGGKIFRSKGFMSLAQFKVIADKIRPYCRHLYLHLWGEPMLNPDIIQIIKYAAQFASTNISTNGMCLTPQLAEELITSGVTEIIVSVDGVTQETYEKYRAGGDVNKALTALKMLRHINFQHGDKVQLIPQFVVFEHNQHEMEAFQNICGSLGLRAAFKAPYIRKGSTFRNSAMPEFTRIPYPNLQARHQAMRECLDAREALTILLDGSVVACCYDHDRTTCFGNIFEEDVAAIWNSRRFAEFRQSILSGEPPAFCRKNCLMYLLDESEQSFPGKRTKTEISVDDFERALEYARSKYREGDFRTCFDTYEQLVNAYPQRQVELLAEVFDKCQPLENRSRYELYQSRFFEFGIKPTDKVLDVGSGHLPFPLATHLADLSLADDSVGRAGIPFKHVDGKPVYECSIESMPFADKEFDFVYCSHVFEHVSDPQKACKEIMRVGKRGFIETPAPKKDLWLNLASLSNHRWSIELQGKKLVFREYTPDDIVGFNCSILMDMNCSPQTPREKAFAGLLNLRADLVNTMLYWEDSFDVEVHRLQQPRTGLVVKPVAIPAGTVSTAVTAALPLRCLFVNTYYDEFLHNIYRNNPEMRCEPYAVQKRTLLDARFGDSDFYSHHLRQAGWDTDDIIVNAAPAQLAWAREHGSKAQGSDVLLEQIRSLKPNVLYIQDMYAYSRSFLKEVRNIVEIIAGQIASPVANDTPFDLYDVVFSSFPHYVERFNSAGVRAVYQALAFDQRVLSQITHFDYDARPVACSFVGGISPMHTKGNQLLGVLVAQTPLQIWGYGRQGLPSDSPICERHNGEAWGKEMYALLASSRITVNRHIDVAENFANNLRLFEATGCGALLITDYKDNLNDLFEIGKEVVAYRTPEDCARLVRYYLDHPDEARTIAEAGQKRTLRDHTYVHRMRRTGAILNHYLQRRKQE